MTEPEPEKKIPSSIKSPTPVGKNLQGIITLQIFIRQGGM